MFSYENLQVYQKAEQANSIVYRFLKANQTIPAYVKNQFGRASLSITLNIAEGSGKFSGKDRRNFYVTARGSVFECTSLVRFLYSEQEIDKNFYETLYTSYDEISRILFAMINNLDKK